MRALPVDPSLGPYPTAAELRPTRIFRLVPVTRRDGELPLIEAASEAEVPPSALGHVVLALTRAVLGPPLRSAALLDLAVSVASGVAAIDSAIPTLRPDTVPIGVAVIGVLLAGNLRGVRQAGAVFAAPGYAFIIAIFAMTAVGLFQAAGRGFDPIPPPSLPAARGISVLLILKAFSSGSTAMTGIEAVSNDIPGFRPIEWRNARATLTWMIVLLSRCSRERSR